MLAMTKELTTGNWQTEDKQRTKSVDRRVEKGDTIYISLLHDFVENVHFKIVFDDKTRGS
jgi:hypothetical protein